MKRRRRRRYLQDAEKLMSAIGKYMGFYSTAAKLAQWAPIALGLLAVFFSPSAWLSETLRRWAVGGVVAGGLGGMAASAALSRRLRDEGRDEGPDAESLMVAMLAAFVASAAALRLHLALVDVGFVERWPVFQPAQDFFLGSDAGEALYNVLAAVWFGSLLFSATLGLALYARWRGERRRAPRADGPEAQQEVRTALETISKRFDALQETVAALQEQNRALRAELEARQAPVERARPGKPAAEDVPEPEA